MRAFVDGYLDHGALCFSKDDAERKLFQMLMDPISTAARREFLALPSGAVEGRAGLSERGGHGPRRESEDGRGPSRRATLHARHGAGSLLCQILPAEAGQGIWTAVSRVSERKKDIGDWYKATVLRRRDDGTFDVRFDCGYVAAGVTVGDVRRGSLVHQRWRRTSARRARRATGGRN